MHVQGVVAINLANQSGSEGVLSKAFEQEARRFSKASSGMRLVPFDFHKQCGATRYDRSGIACQLFFNPACWICNILSDCHFMSHCMSCVKDSNCLARHLPILSKLIPAAMNPVIVSLATVE